MRSRHWDQLSGELGQDLHPDKTFTLDKALKQGLLGHLEVISKTADIASKEYSIEQVGCTFDIVCGSAVHTPSAYSPQGCHQHTVYPVCSLWCTSIAVGIRPG